MSPTSPSSVTSSDFASVAVLTTLRSLTRRPSARLKNWRTSPGWMSSATLEPDGVVGIAQRQPDTVGREFLLDAHDEAVDVADVVAGVFPGAALDPRPEAGVVVVVAAVVGGDEAARLQPDAAMQDAVAIAVVGVEAFVRDGVRGEVVEHDLVAGVHVEPGGDARVEHINIARRQFPQLARIGRGETVAAVGEFLPAGVLEDQISRPASCAGISDPRSCPSCPARSADLSPAADAPARSRLRTCRPSRPPRARVPPCRATDRSRT